MAIACCVLCILVALLPQLGYNSCINYISACTMLAWPYIEMDMDQLSQVVSIAIVIDSEMCALLFRKMGLNR